MSAPLLIVGPGGTLARTFEAAATERALLTARLDHQAAAGFSARVLDELRPWAVVLASDGSEPTFFARLTAACSERGLPLLVLAAGQDPVAQNSRSAENLPQKSGALPPLVVSTAVCFNPWDDGDPVLSALRNPSTHAPNVLPAQAPFSLTYLPDLVHGCLDLLLDGETGSWHLANAGTLNLSMLRRCADGTAAENDAQDALEPIAAPPSPVRRLPLPSWQSAVRCLVDARFPGSR